MPLVYHKKSFFEKSIFKGFLKVCSVYYKQKLTTRYIVSIRNRFSLTFPFIFYKYKLMIGPQSLVCMVPYYIQGGLDMHCPVCNQKYIGKIGRKKFFCPNCYSEVVINKDMYSVFKIDENGTLVKLYEKFLNDLLSPQAKIKEQYNN